MVDLARLNAWLKAPEKFKHHLAPDALLLDASFDPIAWPEAEAFITSLTAEDFTITPEYSWVIVRRDAQWLRVKMDGETITRLDLIASAPTHARMAMVYGYDGTLYSGSQIQPHDPTIQHELENMLKHLFQSDVFITPASRTDALVHALGAVAHFDIPFPMAPEKIKQMLNQMAPKDIVINDVHAVSPFFHARYDVKEKTYLYQFSLQKDVAFMHKKSVLPVDDIAAFEARMKHFEGTHDFRNFAKAKDAKNTVRTIQSVDLKIRADDAYTLEITGQGFLRHMIRMMIGAALHFDGPTIQDGLAHPERTMKKYLAPAEGLYLYAIQY